MQEKIINYLPGMNCGACGFSECEEFANALMEQKTEVANCPILLREEYKRQVLEIKKILKENPVFKGKKEEKIIGLIDNYEADIILSPLQKENSCRETLLPLSNQDLSINETIRYRPLGCPITHFAKIIKTNGTLVTVHIIGPCNRMNNHNDFKDVGLCMVISFEGKYHGKKIKVGDTVRFLPHHCMMQKIHSGVVVELTGNNVLIEGIDLKTWHPAKKERR